MIYSMELSLIGLTFLGLGGAGFVVHRMIKHVDNRIHLMIRASYQNTRNIRENIEIVDVVRSETRKALEHQRMLLSSLNQQLKNLESTICENDPKQAKVKTKRVKLSQAMSEKEGLLGSLDDLIDEGMEQTVANDVQPQPKRRKTRRKKTGTRAKQTRKVVNKDKSKQDAAMGKALEHQRNLLTSLNQQIKNLESTVANESEPERPGIAESQRVKLSEAIARKEGLLSEMGEELELEEAQDISLDEQVEAAPQVVNQVKPEVTAQEMPATSPQPAAKTAAAPAGNKASRVISMSKLLSEEKQRASEQAEKTEKIVKLASMFAKRDGATAVGASENGGATKVRKLSVG